jgi:hypothetical protein
LKWLSHPPFAKRYKLSVFEEEEERNGSEIDQRLSSSR